MSFRTLMKNIKHLSKNKLLNQREDDFDELLTEIRIELGLDATIPAIKSVDDTIDAIEKSSASFVRFGDGELQIINGFDIPFQKASQELSSRLKEVLSSNNKNIFIGIPRFIYHNKENLIDISKKFWRKNGKNFRGTIKKYINNNQQYYAAETTIAFNAYKDFDKQAYFEKIKQIWKNKEIVIVCGKSVFDKIDNNIFECAKSIEYQYAPALNAFEDYNNIIKTAQKVDKSKIIIAILGPTAKVLCYDLAKQGYQTLDLGHIAKSYDWFIKNKNTNNMVDAVDFFNPD